MQSLSLLQPDVTLTSLQLVVSQYGSEFRAVVSWILTGWNLGLDSFVRRLLKECSRRLNFQAEVKLQPYWAKCLLTQRTMTESKLRPKISTDSGRTAPASTFGRQATRPTIFCTMAPTTCEFSVWTLLHLTLPTPKSLSWLLKFCEVYNSQHGSLPNTIWCSNLRIPSSKMTYNEDTSRIEKQQLTVLNCLRNVTYHMVAFTKARRQTRAA
jgi:hypothetical protein